ncbi:hypothetical protein [Desulfitibacter alkalitolerans]|uniref:hypothetical protein n=1 Tax=Desulfitibacter alkalitolerans TaxID=264641 RepID=UPI001FA6D3F6|nr:hypothetical protein [Desulfitibacter alkalitolerans]
MFTQFITNPNGNMQNRKLEEFFVITGFHDLLPLAVKRAKELAYGQIEMIEAICKLSDKLYQYPPTKNRTAWFKTVFEEKLREAKGDILSYKAKKKHLRNK